VVAKELGLSDQPRRNLSEAAAAGKLKGAGGKVVTPEAMEPSRLRAEVARLGRETEIIKKQRRTSRGIFCEVRLD
jgi:transposase